MTMNKKSKALGVGLAASFVLVTGFQNCSSSDLGDVSGSSTAGLACEQIAYPSTAATAGVYVTNFCDGYMKVTSPPVIRLTTGALGGLGSVPYKLRAKVTAKSGSLPKGAGDFHLADVQGNDGSILEKLAYAVANGDLLANTVYQVQFYYVAYPGAGQSHDSGCGAPNQTNSVCFANPIDFQIVP